MSQSGALTIGRWAAPLGSALEYLVAPGARQQNDESTAREINVANMAQRLPEGLRVTWLGTAGFVMEYEGYRLVIDPYLTRSSAKSVLRNRALKPDREQIDRLVPHADAVLVGHTHFDHVLDVPYLARARSCHVYGSSSLTSLMSLWGLAEACEAVQPGRTHALGPFQVTFIPSLHSKLALGLKVPAEGEITCDHLDGMHQGHYRCGQVWGIHIEVAGRTFYHLGSANLIEEELRHHSVDYLLCGIAGRGFTPNFTSRVLRALNPQTVIAHHHDNFFLPLESPMGFSLNVNLGGFVQDVHDVSRDIEVRAFAPLQTIG